MSNCLNCNKELIHVEGRRKKKFCNNSCRVTYWQKTHAKSNNGKPPKEVSKTNKPISAGREPTLSGKHELWKEGDPAEYSTRFYMKYDCDTYEELNQLLNQKK